MMDGERDNEYRQHYESELYRNNLVNNYIISVKDHQTKEREHVNLKIKLLNESISQKYEVNSKMIGNFENICGIRYSNAIDKGRVHID